jgi:hypothetical protein
MDWGNTNSATAYNGTADPTIINSGNWSDRTASTSAMWGVPNGVPIETEVALLNEVDSDGWFNLPTTASDDYMTQEATLVHNTLNSNQKAYIELSNEVWNFSFTQIQYAEEEGEALWPNALTTIDPRTGSDYSAYSIGLNWYAMRAAHMCDIWRSVWGADASRVQCVMGTRLGSTGISTLELNCALWSGAPCASNHGTSALAEAPYFGYNVPDSWTTQPDGGLTDLFTEINSGGLAPGGYSGGMIAQAVNSAAALKPVANSYGLKLVGYESGQGLVDTGDTTLTNLYETANRDPRMGSSTATFVQDLQAAGFNFFNYYNDVGGFSQYGSWGSMESIFSTSTPKYNALVNFVNTTPPASDTTPPSVPANLTATAVTSSSINLSWSASTDNVGVQGYRIFRNGTQIASTNLTTYGDTGLTASTQYSYTVEAYDAAGNDSAPSSSSSATTGAPGLNPTYVGDGTFTSSGNTYTATGVNLGSAFSTRLVIVPVDLQFACTITSATIGGVTATINYIPAEESAGDECVDFISATVPSGSTGDIVLNMSGTTMYGTGYYGVYTIDGSTLSSLTPTTGTASTTGSTSETPSVSATAGGFVLGGYRFGSGASGKNVTISGGFTGDDVENPFGFFHIGSVVTTGTVSAPINWTGSFSSQGAVTAWH